MVEQSLELGQFASRLRSARSLVRMNRKEFCERYGFNLHTVQSWESGRYLVRANSLERFCEALAKEGVFCTPDWIVEGKGDGPKLVGTEKDFTTLNTENNFPKRTSPTAGLEDMIAENETNAFYLSHQSAGIEVVVTRVADNTMLPQYGAGDYVGGRVQTHSNFKSLLGKDCIVEIGPDNFIVRRLLTDGSRIILAPTVSNERALSFDSVESAAEIIWHRRIPRYGSN